MKPSLRPRTLGLPPIAALAAAASLVLGGPALSQDEREAGAPAWFIEDIEEMTRDGGRWIADNSDRRTEDAPYDAYGLEWRAASDGRSMTGRLFGVDDGEESGDFWTFRQFWHPGEERAYVMQWGGGGMYGVGVLTPFGADEGMLEQTFYTADGATFRIGHIYRRPSPDERVTEQYDVPAGKGAWRLDHALTWVRTPVEE